jgi:hypothetical protein
VKTPRMAQGCEASKLKPKHRSNNAKSRYVLSISGTHAGLCFMLEFRVDYIQAVHHAENGNDAMSNRAVIMRMREHHNM